MFLVFLFEDFAMVSLGGVAICFLFIFFLVSATFSLLVRTAVERFLVDGLGCAVDLPLDGVGGATGSAGVVGVSICPPGMHLGKALPRGDAGG